MTPLTEAQQKLVEDNYWMAKHVALNLYQKMCWKAGMTIDERTAEAAAGLVLAAQRYDPQKGKFSSYSYYWAKQRLFRGAYERLRQLNSCVLESDLDEPMPEEMDYRSLRMGGEFNELKNELESVVEVLPTLPPRLHHILCLRYGIKCEQMDTLEEIGKEIGVSRERIRQLIDVGLDILRKRLDNIDIEMEKFNTRPWPGPKARRTTAAQSIMIIEAMLPTIRDACSIAAMARNIIGQTKLKQGWVYHVLFKFRKTYLTKEKKWWTVNEKWRNEYLTKAPVHYKQLFTGSSARNNVKAPATMQRLR